MATAVSDLECRDRNQENRDFHKQWEGGNAIKLKSASKNGSTQMKTEKSATSEKKKDCLPEKSKQKKVWMELSRSSTFVLPFFLFFFSCWGWGIVASSLSSLRFFPRLKNVICFATNMTFVPFNFLYQTFIYPASARELWGLKYPSTWLLSIM